MTVDVWKCVSELSDYLNTRFTETGNDITHDVSDFNWHNNIYTSSSYRRAHVEVVDFRDTYKTYILHCTIFPHFNDPSPIWGFDAVCGANKITGAFHDFSASGEPTHPMMQWFSDKSSKYIWKKPRQLPEWAKAIFSPAMIAAGNVNTEEEITALCDLAKDSLNFYLDNVGKTQESGSDYHMAQNRYCHYQKQNPHVTASMIAMGIPEQKIKIFVDTLLFPETWINTTA